MAHWKIRCWSEITGEEQFGDEFFGSEPRVYGTLREAREQLKFLRSTANYDTNSGDERFADLRYVLTEVSAR